jgi:hypothetical protein
MSVLLATAQSLALLPQTRTLNGKIPLYCDTAIHYMLLLHESSGNLIIA